MFLSAHTTFKESMLPHRASVTKLRVRKNVKSRSAQAFTLVELLVVMGILAILSSIVILSLSGIKGSRDLSKAAYDVQGALEQARTTAMAGDTYTWVGFFEEDANTPGVAGTGQVVISIVGSASGTNPVVSGSAIPSSGLTQLAKLIRLPNTHLTAVPAAAVTRPSITASTPANYQVGSGSFANNNTTFSYPLNGATQYTFSQIIQFSPQGDATRIADNPTPVMEVGLQPTHGNVIGTTGNNYAVVQVSGIGGQVITYRP